MHAQGCVEALRAWCWDSNLRQLHAPGALRLMSVLWRAHWWSHDRKPIDRWGSTQVEKEWLWGTSCQVRRTEHSGIFSLSLSLYLSRSCGGVAVGCLVFSQPQWLPQYPTIPWVIHLQGLPTPTGKTSKKVFKHVDFPFSKGSGSGDRVWMTRLAQVRRSEVERTQKCPRLPS